MARRVFFSFHYDNDNWRAAQIRNIGALEGNKEASSNEWEQVKRGGDQAIKRWIDGQMQGKSCVIVLVGRDTAMRKWIDYEISSGWNSGKAVFGIYVDNLLDRNGNTCYRGSNPFQHFTENGTNRSMASVVPVHDPFGFDSKGVYATISSSIAGWIEDALRIRAAHT